MMLHARGIEQQTKGVDNVLGRINLGLATGKFGKPGCGVSTITGQGNGQGGREHGHKCDQLPGNRDITNPEHRAARRQGLGLRRERDPRQGPPGPGDHRGDPRRAPSRACCRSASTRSSRRPTPTSPPRRSTSSSSTSSSTSSSPSPPSTPTSSCRVAARGGRGHLDQRRGPHHQDQRRGHPARRGPPRLADPARDRRAPRQGRVLPLREHRGDLRRAPPGIAGRHRRLHGRHLGADRGRARAVLAHPRGRPPRHAPAVRGREVLPPRRQGPLPRRRRTGRPPRSSTTTTRSGSPPAACVSQYLSGTQTRRIAAWSTSTPSRSARSTPRSPRRSASPTATWSPSRRGAATITLPAARGQHDPPRHRVHPLPLAREQGRQPAHEPGRRPAVEDARVQGRGGPDRSGPAARGDERRPRPRPHEGRREKPATASTTARSSSSTRAGASAARPASRPAPSAAPIAASRSSTSSASTAPPAPRPRRWSACTARTRPAPRSARPMPSSRPRSGIVQSALKPRCIGCSNCVLACPFGVPKYVADFDQMMKCDMCTDRTSEGYAPMCASVCPSEALWYGTPEEFHATRAGRSLDNWLFGRQACAPRSSPSSTTWPAARSTSLGGSRRHLARRPVRPGGALMDDDRHDADRAHRSGSATSPTRPPARTT